MKMKEKKQEREKKGDCGREKKNKPRNTEGKKEGTTHIEKE